MMGSEHREFATDPPFASVTFQQAVAEFLKQCQMEAFTGKIILHMHKGHVGAVEPQHAPIKVEQLTGHIR